MASTTIKPAMMALVVAMAWMMLPAMPFATAQQPWAIYCGWSWMVFC